MKPHKSTILIMLFGLLLVAFVAVMAQQTPQGGEQKKQAEVCCAMESCCCKGDSCPMKKEGAETAEGKEGCCGDSCKLHHSDPASNTETAKNNNHENAKHDSASHAGCCAESCNMAKHEKHDGKTHSPDGSCCKMKQKDAKKQAKTN